MSNNNPYREEMLRLKERVHILEDALAQSSRLQLQWQHTCEQLKQAQQSLDESKNRFLAIFEYSTNGMIITDQHGAIQMMNPEAMHMLGCDEETQPEHIRDIFSRYEEDLPEMKDRRARRHSGLITHRDEITLVRADGSPLVVSLSLICILQQNTPLLLLSMQDLTRHMLERRELQAIIAQRAERLLNLSRALEATNEAVVIVNPDGLIEYANPAYLDMWGYSAEEIKGERAAILKSGQQDDAFYACLWRTIMTGEAWEERIINRCRDGQLKAVRLSISPVFDEHHSIINFVGIYRDMTQQEQLARHMLQTQKMEAISTLVSGIAHEFNNILAGMTGNLYLAKTLYPDDEEICSYLDNAEQQGFRAAEMIQKLMTFSHKDWVDEQNIDLNTLVEDLVHLGRLAIPEHIELEIHTAAEPLMIHADTSQIPQILLHLVQNAHDALKHAKHGKIQLTVSRWAANSDFLTQDNEHSPRQYACIRIQDNGIGISEKDLPHIFEPFYTSKDVGEGSGLGLAAVFGAIERLGGMVEVSSEPGNTCFELLIPLVNPMDTQQKSAEKQPEEKQQETQMPSILLVDDEQEVLNITAKILASLGHPVAIARDGEEAVRYYEHHHDDIDLVISDISMPRLDGVEAAACMRKIRPELPVIFVSGYDQEYFDRQVSEDAHTRLIIRPLHIGELSKTIRQMLQN